MDDRSARLDLGHDAGAPRVARRFVTRLLDGWGVSAEAVERCQLLVSELVSNAILHGRGPVELTIAELDARRSVYRIEVCNGGEGSPTMKRADKHDLSGRGLHLVDRLSRGWGSDTADGTTRVWFELHAGVAS